LIRKKVTSSTNAQSSLAVMTDGFVLKDTASHIEPTPDNFASLIIKNGSDVSIKIKQLIERTKSWLKTESDTQEVAVSDDNSVQAALTPQPLTF
jgi:hypothetical protein